MAKFPTFEEMCKNVAEEALDGYIYKGKTLREWIDILVQIRWIPVSERLPKIADVYRVTRYYPNNVMNPEYLVDACFFDGSNTWYNDNRINHERDYANNVIAWQENPEPYKAEIINRNLCDSCTNKGCILQSGIIRNHCDFYMSESEK